MGSFSLLVRAAGEKLIQRLYKIESLNEKSFFSVGESNRGKTADQDQDRSLQEYLSAHAK